MEKMENQIDGKKIAILGASRNPDRYSNMLVRRLSTMGRDIYPVHPAHDKIEGKKVYPSISSLPKDIDIMSLYVNEARSNDLADEIVNSGIPTVIFNPGAENQFLEDKLRKSGRQVIHACSLVMAGTGKL